MDAFIYLAGCVADGSLTDAEEVLVLDVVEGLLADISALLADYFD